MKNKISILLPAYNRPEYLKKTISSILQQSYSNFELIISDDKSPVNLTNVVKKFKDKRISFYRQKKNLGFIKNWNFCIKKSKGEYIKIVGDDDILLKECLKKELDIMQKSPNIDLLFSNYITIDQKGGVVNNNRHNINTFRLFDHDQIENGFDLIKNYFMGKRLIGLPTAVLFKKSLLSKTGLFDENIGCPADVDMWLRMAQFTDIYYADSVFVKMRWHGNNLSKALTQGPTLYKADFNVLYKHYGSLKKRLTFMEKNKIFNIYSRKILGRIKDNFKNIKYIKQYLKDLIDLSMLIYK